MRINTKDKVYVQLSDISMLIRYVSEQAIPIPESVMDKCFNKPFICTINNRHEFMAFEGQDAINFFNKLEYILDYSEVKDLNYDELDRLYTQIDKEIAMTVNEYDSLDQKKQNKKYNYYATQIAFKNYKMSSIYEFTEYKKGILKLNMPSEADNIITPPDSKKRTRSIFNKERWTHRRNR